MNVKVFQVEKGFVKNQCYLLYSNSTGVLVDPAWNYELINDFLLDNQIRPEAVLLTHAHPDHTNLAPRFAAVYNIPVYMSATEMADTGYTCLHLTEVRDLEIINVSGLKILPVVTPGHTSGSTCYLAGKHFFCGDTIFIEGVGICTDAEAMFDTVQLLKSFLPSQTMFWPGHSFGQPPGKDLEFILKNNIYFQFEKKRHFVDFRTRKNGPDPFLFI